MEDFFLPTMIAMFCSSTDFENKNIFPEDSIKFNNAMKMEHEWKSIKKLPFEINKVLQKDGNPFPAF